jgi:hypothetical protein
MKLIELTSLNSDQKTSVFNLWNEEYPAQLSYNSLDEFNAYLSNLSNQKHYLLYNSTSEIVGWGFEFVREEEKWFAIIIKGAYHGSGNGTRILAKLKDNNSVLSGWVIDHNRDRKFDGSTYPSPLQFYLKNHFIVVSGVRLELEKISAVKIMWTKS